MDNRTLTHRFSPLGFARPGREAALMAVAVVRRVRCVVATAVSVQSRNAAQHDAISRTRAIGSIILGGPCVDEIMKRE